MSPCLDVSLVPNCFMSTVSMCNSNRVSRVHCEPQESEVGCILSC